MRLMQVRMTGGGCPVLAVRDTQIRKNDRICQFRIMEHQPQIQFVEGTLEAPDRGGFGSTGKN